MGRLRRAARAALCGVLMLAASAGAAQDRSGFDTGGMDRNVRPGDDFFAYANGAWARRTPIPADRSAVGTIGAPDDRSLAQVRAILDDAAHDPGSRMGTAYRAFLDTAAIERLGMAPVAAMLARLHAIRTRDDYVAAAADAGRRRVR
jgi:putative endopeptidase